MDNSKFLVDKRVAKNLIQLKYNGLYDFNRSRVQAYRNISIQMVITMAILVLFMYLNPTQEVMNWWMFFIVLPCMIIVSELTYQVLKPSKEKYDAAVQKELEETIREAYIRYEIDVLEREAQGGPF